MSSYGHFDDKNREYVINRPDTPLPWLNMLGQDEFSASAHRRPAGIHFGRTPGCAA